MSRNNLLHMRLTNNPNDVPESRMRGVSTALAIGYVSQAILQPNTKIVVRDHVDIPQCNKRLLKSIEWVVKRLSLLGFEVGYDAMLARDFVRCNMILKQENE